MSSEFKQSLLPCLKEKHFNVFLVFKVFYGFLAEESSETTPTEPFGHIILREKLSTTYHQENDCNLIGPLDQISEIGSNSSFSSADSSFTSVQILATVTESQVTVIPDHTDRSLETIESKLHAKDQSIPLPVYSGTQVQAESEFPSKICGFPLVEHASSVLQCIQENHSDVGDKSNSVYRIAERQVLQENKPAFVNNYCPSSDAFIDPLVNKYVGKETHSEKKTDSVVQHCERILSIDDEQDEMDTGHLKSNLNNIGMTNMEELTQVSSVSEESTSPPVHPAASLKNCVPSTLIISEESKPLAQVQDSTSPTQMVPLLSLYGKCSPQEFKSKEDINSKTLSPCSTPLGGPLLDELPRFTNQRPSNLPSTTGTRSPFINWNSSSPVVQRYCISQTKL